MVNYARSLTRDDRTLAEDLVQTTCVNALAARNQFIPGTNIKAWLFTILKNRFLSLKGRKFNTEISLDAVTDEEDDS